MCCYILENVGAMLSICFGPNSRFEGIVGNFDGLSNIVVGCSVAAVMNQSGMCGETLVVANIVLQGKALATLSGMRHNSPQYRLDVKTSRAITVHVSQNTPEQRLHQSLDPLLVSFNISVKSRYRHRKSQYTHSSSSPDCSLPATHN